MRLGPAETAARLAALPGWLEQDGVIEKTFRFPDYYRVMAFVNAVAFVAHRDDHHPELAVHYGKVVVQYTSHDAGGLTTRDLDAAAKVDALYA